MSFARGALVLVAALVASRARALDLWVVAGPSYADTHQGGGEFSLCMMPSQLDSLPGVGLAFGEDGRRVQSYIEAEVIRAAEEREGFPLATATAGFGPALIDGKVSGWQATVSGNLTVLPFVYARYRQLHRDVRNGGGPWEFGAMWKVPAPVWKTKRELAEDGKE